MIEFESVTGSNMDEDRRCARLGNSAAFPTQRNNRAHINIQLNGVHMRTCRSHELVSRQRKKTAIERSNPTFSGQGTAIEKKTG